MYALEIIDCTTFIHARALRQMLEGDGFPAVAATITTSPGGKAHSVVITAARQGYADQLWGVSLGFSLVGEAGIADIAKVAHRPGRQELPDAVPKEARDGIRNALQQALDYAADVVMTIEPGELPTTIGSAIEASDEVTTPVKNPRGGGWDERCPD
jgi:hypothetical protein